MKSDLSQLSELIAHFMDERDWGQYHTPKNLAAAIAVEAAELQEIYLWRAGDDPCADKREAIEAEVADIAICLLNFCNRTQIDLDAAVRSKLAIAAQKYPAERVRGRREKYDEYPEFDTGSGGSEDPVGGGS
ncbi:MAG TPA: nucleotide pyrophosphohydrolase [Deltaproteobacteria bacterium]|nr:nucleotide pyrophosphohydrolase [Deltaproteobacteria bacterium]HCP45995.1 nucleotide pyrophosphohydrolase [Deltaproteobacteria bacterium]|tara:strand:- start:96 stop:491 length:396 start_codon:yes stop_codon:yes gene_type:complete